MLTLPVITRLPAPTNALAQHGDEETPRKENAPDSLPYLSLEFLQCIIVRAHDVGHVRLHATIQTWRLDDGSDSAHRKLAASAA